MKRPDDRRGGALYELAASWVAALPWTLTRQDQWSREKLGACCLMDLGSDPQTYPLRAVCPWAALNPGFFVRG